MTDDLRFKIVKVINVLASKNTTEVRSLMKGSGLFELRDTLLLELLNSEVHTAESIQLLQQINLDALAGSSKFKESKTIESLVSWIVETKDSNIRKGIIEIFQKQICKSPENLKYISKVVEDPNFVALITTKSLDEVENFLKDNKAEVRKNLDKVMKVANAQQSERIKSQLKSGQERSTRRNKTFADISKEKSVIQNALNDYQVSVPLLNANRFKKRNTSPQQVLTLLKRG